MKTVTFLIVLFFLIGRINVVSAAAEIRVLVLLSLDVTYPYVKSKVDGLAFEGAKHQKKVLLDIQYLEDQRFTDSGKLHDYYLTRAEQLKNSHPDIIAISGSPVIFSFYNDYLYPLLPDVPMVGETRIVPEDHRPPAYSFIEYHQNIPKTINMALEMTNPKNIFLIGDATHPGSRLSMQLVKQNIPENVNVNVKYLDMPIDDLIMKANYLPVNSVGFFSLIFSDGKGNRMVPETALQKIADQVPFPIFAFHETMVGSGATGGIVAKGEDVGVQLVREAMLALESVPFKPPRIVPAVSTTLFDGHYMDKFGISRDKLPESAEVINLSTDLLDQYYVELLAVIALIIFLSLMLVILFHYYNQKKQLSMELSMINNELEQRVDDRTQNLLMENDALHKKESEITQMMLTDLLTDLPNRRFFEDEVQREFKRSQRSNSDLCIAICDIDHFKQINDFFGHKVGDIVLTRLAQCINQTVRETDFVARWGGEEFVIIHIDTNRTAAEKLSERVRVAIEKLWLDELGKGVTISIGIAQRNEADTVSDLLHRSDMALYQSKSDGRNCVTFI